MEGVLYKFAPVLGGDGKKIVPPRDIFDRPLYGRSSIRSKLDNHVGYMM